MATDSNAVLKDLIEACRDGQNGYRDAAEHVTDSSLKSFFNEQSLERTKFAGELEQELQRLAEPRPDKGGSIAGAVHRKWMVLAAATMPFVAASRRARTAPRTPMKRRSTPAACRKVYSLFFGASSAA